MAQGKVTSRRDFIEKMAAGGALAGSILLGSNVNRPRTPVNKAVLTAADFSFVGAFRLPFNVNGQDAGYGRGLAHRYVNGELRFLTMTLPNNVYEVAFPGTTLNAPYPLAQTARYWGDVYHGKRQLDGGASRESGVWGLYWDAPDHRLYWSYGDGYNAVSANDPSIGYSTLNDQNGTSQAAGAWRFAGRGCKATMGGITPIPRWFADAYCGGRRLGAGFGGYFSIVGVGPAHLGPALCAFAPPDLAINPNLSTLAFNDLVGYPFNLTPYTAPDRCHRDTDYTNEFDGWNPRDGVGYFSWTDYIWQGAVWIDTPTKHGLVYFPTLGNGRTWYQNSTLNATRASHWWFVYDPADLARVAQGQKQQWEIQPRNTWRVNYPGMLNPLPGWSDEPRNMITGVTFDPATGHLYIAVRFGWATGGAGENGHTIYVYKVNQLAPTAATVSLSGRVVRASGRGIAAARLSLTDSTGEMRVALTNSFGYYRFDSVAGAAVSLAAWHKHYSFSPNQRNLTPLGDTADLNFYSTD